MYKSYITDYFPILIPLLPQCSFNFIFSHQNIINNSNKKLDPRRDGEDIIHSYMLPGATRCRPTILFAHVFMLLCLWKRVQEARVGEQGKEEVSSLDTGT